MPEMPGVPEDEVGVIFATLHFLQENALFKVAHACAHPHVLNAGRLDIEIFLAFHCTYQL